MTTMAVHEIDQTTINTIRFLAIDMVEQANSGHPGAPMGQAALAYRLWNRFLCLNPKDPDWLNRDRFVLSCGHASALLYALLHLSGHDLSLDELKNFRQLGSKTAGHPEFGHAPGIETTTGPLGQGLANAVGMAVAERHLGARFNREGYPIFDHRVWVLASDGDLMEGVAAEASSFAGHHRLGKLKVFYDANSITIDGSTDLTFTEDVRQRYESYGWQTLTIEDGNDLEEIDRVTLEALDETERPSLILVKTHIGFGSPNKQDRSSSHGAPLGSTEVAATRAQLGWPHEESFQIPEEAREAFGDLRDRGREAHTRWAGTLKRYADEHPDLAAELDRRHRRELPEGWTAKLPSFDPDAGPLATRKASGAILGAVAADLPELLGGSADLAGSNNTTQKGEPFFSPAAPGGRNFHFGVREHGMGAIMNGMALSGLLRPYGGTFLIFSDYMRPAIRLAALMSMPAIYVLTHDSIFLGEDGPTHQPISQLLSMRSIPGLQVIRPADANETAQAWRLALETKDGPTALILTRQKLPILAQAAAQPEGVARGGYVLSDPSSGAPKVALVASGSEVSLALEAQRQLAEKGVPARVVSLPCWSLFDAQDAAYRESVLPTDLRARVAIEAGSSIGWHKYVGIDGEIIAQDGYGASAPASDLARHFGFTPEAVCERVLARFGVA